MGITKEITENHDAYQPIPLWVWNDELQSEELMNQIEEMQGYGEFFIHARNGLGASYLGKEMSDSVKLCKKRRRTWL